ncbi:helix-turn-helix domain-containing protein [Nonomuraea sp. GTA35]|uniref:helix-turn-helix domain-containing protein n=1 Tax=Nonomuraea sp. GTA35 TaxID=1676746 RepID=UPI0035BF8776
MDAQRISPPLRLRRLGRILRDLRTREQITLAQTGRCLGWSTAKVGRIEAGQTRPSPADVAASLDLFGASDEVRRTCMALAAQAAARPWWAPYRRVLGEYVALETEAELVRSWQPQLVEGLLQTEAYARALMVASLPEATGSEVDLRVRARMARQRLLAGGDPLVLSVVLAEDALRVPVGGARVMAAQMTHLVEVAQWPNVTLRVLPRRVGAHPGMSGAFVLLSLAQDPVSVFVEGAPQEIVTDEVALVRGYERRFHCLSASALTAEDSLEILGQIARELERDAD